MRPMLFLACLLGLATGTSGLGQASAAPDELASARIEQAKAEAELKRLEAAAAAAKSRAERLARERRAAAMAIELSEARITAATIRLSRESARLAELKRRLAAAQRPVSSLLAGLVMMGERPPIVALADRGGIEELVRARVLLRATMPTVRARSAALARGIGAIENQEKAAGKARAAWIADRDLLAERQTRLARLEERAFEAALAAGGAALESGDRVLAGRETMARAPSARGMARELLAGPPAPPRPGGGSLPAEKPGAPYRLPADAPVLQGLAEIDRGGVRSRGLTLATRRGAPVIVPASGTLRFAGPFEAHDGIAVIDHGGGWFTLIVNVAVPLRSGARLEAGETLGRALGPIEVELSRNGHPMSPAIIAGSSAGLFKRR